MKRLSIKPLIYIAIACTLPVMALSCKSDKQDSTQKEAPAEKARRGAIDKSGDSTLQTMITTVMPKFKQKEYADAKTGKTLEYNLLTPANMDPAKKYPLVLFMGDASTVGEDPTLPLDQGYGALVWGTDEWQAEHPCYVLVPQFTTVAVNDEYKTSDEADIVMRLLNTLNSELNIDTDRLYTTGQSMGGMLSMYYDVAYPKMFAAAIFVDSHWDKAKFESLVKHKFIYFIAGEKGKAYPCLEPLEDAARAEGVQYTYAQWSAQLPVMRQDELAATMLGKGAPVNIFEFEPNTVIPAGVDVNPANEHMYSFDCAYRITAAREWLFAQHR